MALRSDADLGSLGESALEACLSQTVVAMLSDHVIGGRVLFPGVGYVEMALSAGGVIAAPGKRLVDVVFVRPCTLPLLENGALRSCTQEVIMRYVHSPEDDGFEVRSVRISSGSRSSFMTHARGIDAA